MYIYIHVYTYVYIHIVQICMYVRLYTFCWMAAKKPEKRGLSGRNRSFHEQLAAQRAHEEMERAVRRPHRDVFSDFRFRV